MEQVVATQIRVGMILKVDGDLYKVSKTQHVTPGKGVACMQTKLKNIFNGKNLDGWEVKIKGHGVGKNYKNTFKVKNGSIKVSYDEYKL